MKRCYFLGGIPGSELQFFGSPNVPYWVDPGALFNLGLAPLQLQDDGVTDVADGHPPRVPNGPILSAYGNTMKTLEYQLQHAENGDPEYRVIGVGYDFRKDIIRNGQLLSAVIQQENITSNPCSIVAHSMGGLVARAAWYDLNTHGRADLVRRIVTIGTPHRGSLSPVQTWEGKDGFLSKLSLASYVATGIAGPFRTGRPMSQAEISAIISTWPGWYQLLPTFKPLGADAPDENLWKVFDAHFYGSNLNVKQSLLNAAKNVWQPFLANPSSMPPPWVITSVASVGLSTPYRVKDNADFNNQEALEYSVSGDGAVMFTSALATPGRQVNVPNLVHSSMHLSLVNSGALHPLVLEQSNADLVALWGSQTIPWSVDVNPEPLHAQTVEPKDTVGPLPTLPPNQLVQMDFVVNIPAQEPGSVHLAMEPLPGTTPTPGPGLHC